MQTYVTLVTMPPRNKAPTVIDNDLFHYDPDTRLVTFKFDGFLRGDLMKKCAVQIATILFVISSSSGSRGTALGTFRISYPELPIVIKQPTVSDCILVHPCESAPKGNYGPTYTLGVPHDVLEAYISVSHKEGYKMSSDMSRSRGYYWINCTVDSNNRELMYMLDTVKNDKGEIEIVQITLHNEYSMLYSLTVDKKPVNTIGYVTLDFKLKTTVPAGESPNFSAPSIKSSPWVNK